MSRPSRSIVALLVCSVTLLAGTAARAQSNISLDEYAARLRASLQSLEASDPAADPTQTIDTAIASLDLPVLVRLPDGSTVEVTRDGLLGDAGSQGNADALDRVTARVRIASEAAEAATTTTIDRAAIDASLAAAYDDFRPKEPSWGSRILTYFLQGLGWLFDRTLGAVARSSGGALLGWVLIAGLLVTALVVLERVRRETVTESRWTSTSGEAAHVDWRKLADEALARGDLPEAVRARYHVLLSTLASRGVVRDAPSLTSGECRAAVRRARPSAALDIDRAMTVFERIVYGQVRARAEDVETLRAAERAVLRP